MELFSYDLDGNGPEFGTFEGDPYRFFTNVVGEVLVLMREVEDEDAVEFGRQVVHGQAEVREVLYLFLGLKLHQ